MFHRRRLMGPLYLNESEAGLSMAENGKLISAKAIMEIFNIKAPVLGALRKRGIITPIKLLGERGFHYDAAKFIEALEANGYMIPDEARQKILSV